MNTKTLVLGASLKPERYSHLAINRLIGNDIEVVAFGLRKGDVGGVLIDTELKDYKNIDTVTMYINPKRQVAFYDYIVSLKPRRVIFNPGTENMEFYKILQENNIKPEIACTLVLLATNQYQSEESKEAI